MPSRRNQGKGKRNNSWDHQRSNRGKNTTTLTKTKNQDQTRPEEENQERSEKKDQDAKQHFRMLSICVNLVGLVFKIPKQIMGLFITKCNICYNCFTYIFWCKWWNDWKSSRRDNKNYHRVPSEDIDIEYGHRRNEISTGSKEDYNQKLRTAEIEKDKLAERLEDVKKEYSSLENEKVALFTRLKDVEKRNSILQKERDDAKIWMQEHRNEIDSIKKDKSQLLSRVQQHKTVVDTLKTEKTITSSRLKELERKISDLQIEKEDALTRFKELERKISDLQKEKGDALTRLSEVMGTKLRDNNPAITNLNDPNRPIRISEQFSELYENEWTDVYSDLLDSKDLHLTERETIRILLDILKEIYDLCLKDVAEQLSGHKKTLTGLSDDDIEDFMKAVKDSLKINAPKYVPLLLKKIATYCPDCPTVTHYKSCSLPYINSCVKICYFAVVQDPPMPIDFEPGHIFDKQLFKEYSRSGTTVEYLVWPALYLRKGGPMLSKGVVQPHAKQTDY